MRRLHRPDHRAGGRLPGGQVDYTIEYYTTGHLTKFVKPGAYRIDSTANGTIQNVAWKNPDGSKALIAHNGGTSSQSVRVNWGNQSFVYTLPARTTATFTWSGTPGSGGGGGTGTSPITGLAGKCIDVAGAATANGTAIQLYTCNGTGAQSWTRDSSGRLSSLGKCLDIAGPNAANGTLTHLWDCHTGTSQKWTYNSSTQQFVNQFSGTCLDVKDNSSADGARLQIWSCTTGANQKWTFS
ncbi:ricin-type beta-trefoil lectin domain protein [Catellatospora coxensis]